MEEELNFTADLLKIEERIFNYINLVLAIYITPLLITSLLRINYTGFKWVYIFHIFIVAIIWLLFLLRKKTKFTSRVIAFIIILSTLLIPSIPSFGAQAYWEATVMVIVFITAMFLGRRAGFLFLSYVALYIIVFGYLFIIKPAIPSFSLILKSSVLYDLLFRWSLIIVNSLIIIYAIGRYRDFFVKSMENFLLAERKAEESEAKYKQLADVTFEGIVIHDKGIVIDVNLSLAKMSGYTREELIGINVMKLVHEKYHALVNENISKDYAEPYEFIAVRKDGSTFPVEVEARNYKTEDNKTLRVTAVRDITKRKKIEEELREKEIKYSYLFNNSLETIWATDKQFNLIYVNEAAYNFMGYTLEEFMGMNPADYTAPEGMKLLRENAEKLIAEYQKGKIRQVKFEVQQTKKDGTVIDVEITGQLLLNDKGEFIGFQGRSIDITDRKKIEKQLKNQTKEIKLNNERLESLLEISRFQTKSVKELLDFALHEAIRLTNSKIGFIFYYDNATQQLILNSWSKDVMKECKIEGSNNIFDLADTGLWAEPIRQRKPILINDYQADNPMKHGTPEGHVEITKYLAAPVFSENNIVAIVAVANKPTDYDDSDIRQLTLLMDNAWKISERVTLIEELQNAKEKAEESEKLKTEFLQNISHEVRTPLNGILGFSNFLIEPDLTHKERTEYLNIIRNSGNQLLRIIDDIMEISQLGTKQVKVTKKQICLNKLLSELYSIFDIEAKTNKIPLYLKKGLPDKESTILTDKTKLVRILNSLLENSFKFTSEGFIEFGYLLKTDNEPAELEIYVKDTGIGIKPESQNTIFVRFSQEEKELSKKVGGLGLGLSIAKENVKLLGGNITVESQKGKGSTFFVTIPYEPVYLKAKKRDSKDNKHKKDIKKEKYTVLIAEDEAINYLFLAIFLKEHGPNLVTLHARNGKEAVEMCKKNPKIDFVFMDLKMPRMSGFEATKLIKEFRPELPIVAQTAYSTEEKREQALLAGCDDFISKPIEEHTLKEIIEKYFVK
ncbi:MAG: PAS domain S-box protein [Calditrichaeota bacterium]|nr:PAS domain S-box protein [Calditrichota bacterium]